MKKRKTAARILSVLLALFLPFGGLPMFASAASPFASTPFFTGFTLTDTTSQKLLYSYDGNSGTPTDPGVQNIGKGDNVRLDYTFMIPNNITVTSGDTYTFSVPGEISVPAGTTYDLNVKDPQTGAPVKIGAVAFAAGGSGTITFEDVPNKYNNVNGDFYINSTFAGSGISNTTPVPLTFTWEGHVSVEADLNFAQQATNLAKSDGTYHGNDSANPSDTVSWAVTVNGANNGNSGGTAYTAGEKTTIAAGTTLSDAIPAGLSYVPGSLKITDTTTGSTVYDDSAPSGSAFTAEADGSSWAYTFPAATSAIYTVTYDTAVKDPGAYGQSLTNTATLTKPDGATTLNTAKGTVTPSPTYIKKAGALGSPAPGDPGHNKIDWTVTFNQPNRPLHGAKITDALPKGLAVDTATLKLNGVVPSSYSITGDAAGGETLTVNAGDISSVSTLTFTTDISAGYWSQNEGGFNNTAVLTTTDPYTYFTSGNLKGSSGVVPGTSNPVLGKKGMAYNPSTHVISWQVTVNGAKQQLAKPTVTDTLPTATGGGSKTAQTYNAGTFTVKDGSGSIVYQDGSSTYTSGSFTNDTADNKLVYTFAGDITGTYTITYDTAATDSADYASNGSFTATNSVSMTTGDGYTTTLTNVPYSAPASDTLDKSANYDYVSRELTYTLNVNNSELPLQNVVITDPLTGNNLDAFDLETGTLAYSTPLGGSNALDLGSSADSLTAGQYYYDSSTRLLTTNLGDLNDATAANRKATVTFKLKVHDPDSFFAQNNSIDVKNTATMSSTVGGQTVTVTAPNTYTIQNGLLTKADDYTNGNGYIDWIVHINQNAVHVYGLTLTDSLPAGLVLDRNLYSASGDTTGIRVYPQTLASGGSLSPDGISASAIDSAAATQSLLPLALGSSAVGYTVPDNASQNSTFTLTLPKDGSDASGDYIDQPYVLIFRTYVQPAYYNKTFSNTITFQNGVSDVSSNSSSATMSFASGGAGAYGDLSTVSITKKDSVSNKLLPGAVYGLFDASGNKLQAVKTDASGAADVNFLFDGTLYDMRELQAPFNYQLDPHHHWFQVVKGSPNTIESWGDSDTATGQPSNTSTMLALPLSDTINTGTITVKKTDGSNPLAGAVFTLYPHGSNTPTSYTATSGTDGVAQFENIPYGNYDIRETAAPADYLLSSANPAVVPADLEGAANSLVLDCGTVSDSIKTAQIRFVKKSPSGTPLAGATFKLFRMPGMTPVLLNGQPAVSTSGADGIISFGGTSLGDGVPYGDYELVETASPAGFYAVASISVSLHDASPVQNGVLDLGTVTDTVIVPGGPSSSGSSSSSSSSSSSGSSSSSSGSKGSSGSGSNDSSQNAHHSGTGGSSVSGGSVNGSSVSGGGSSSGKPHVVNPQTGRTGMLALLALLLALAGSLLFVLRRSHRRA